MNTKAGAEIDHLHPDVTRIFPLIEEARLEALHACSNLPCVVTSGHEGHQGDGVHGKRGGLSWHYLENCPTGEGLASDFRTQDFVRTWAAILEAKLREKYGAQNGYDVVAEGNHLHVERDAKTLPLQAKSPAGGVTG